MSEVGLIALALAREILLGYFRLLEVADLTQEERAAHYAEVRKEFFDVDLDLIPDPNVLNLKGQKDLDPKGQKDLE